MTTYHKIIYFLGARKGFILGITGIFVIAMGSFFLGRMYARQNDPFLSVIEKMGMAPEDKGRLATLLATQWENQSNGMASPMPMVIRGEIIEIGKESMTVKEEGGASGRIVFISPTTEVVLSSMGSNDDLETGDTVTIIAESNGENGMATAKAIQRGSRAK